MTEVALKRSLGLTLIAVHCISLLLAIALFFASGLTFEQLTTTAAIIAPMFAGFTTQALTFFTNSRLRSDDVSSPITRDYALLSFAFPLILGVLVWVSMMHRLMGRLFAISSNSSWRSFCSKECSHPTRQATRAVVRSNRFRPA
jgi:hypothetical protein